MPYDIEGTRADIAMDPGSVPSRMNAGRVYEHYFNGISRKTQKLVRDSVGFNEVRKNILDYSDAEITNAFSIVLEILEIIGTEQYVTYNAITDIGSMREIVEEILYDEFFILYTVSSNKKPYQIVSQVANTKFAPVIDRITIVENGVHKRSENKILIAPIYTILLAKTADNFLSTASAKTNHYGLPIGVGNNGKYRMPWRNSPVKVLSETESRLYVSYVSRLALAELKDRANSIKTHESVYKTILESDVPSNIDRVVDRNKIPYGGDAALELVNSIFNVGGINIKYTPDKNKIHPVT